MNLIKQVLLSTAMIIACGPTLAVASTSSGSDTLTSGPGLSAQGFIWRSPAPADSPFDQSETLTGIYFTGRHSDYVVGDTFYPSWASDGNLYSPWTDGRVEGVNSYSYRWFGWRAQTGNAVLIGDDPRDLVIKKTSMPQVASARPYAGRYPAGSLVHNGVWYYGTYTLGPSPNYKSRGFKWNWPILGPMPGFRVSHDYGKTWKDSPHTPAKPLFPEPAKMYGPVKMGAPHFVDFGQNMAHSPDGKAYLLGMGAEENDPRPRPCIKKGSEGTAYEIVEPCEPEKNKGVPFANGNLSWITADQIYLSRVAPSPETINDENAYEYFSGHDENGAPIWSNDFDQIKPLLEWNNNMGCVTATYVPQLKKYLMAITDGWPTVTKMDSYILEADELTGPWRMVAYLEDFGEQAYFLNFPSKFISPDGRTLWLAYSANFIDEWNGVDLEFNPPGGRYGLSLHELRLLGPEDMNQARKLRDQTSN